MLGVTLAASFLADSVVFPNAPLFEEVHRFVHRGGDPSVALERLMRIAPHVNVR